MAQNSTSKPARPWVRQLQRWLPVGLGAAGLLAVSQLLWLWESWPVRQLLALESLPGIGR